MCIRDRANASQRREMFRLALLILLPSMVLIVLVSIGLTRSIRKLTRKVRQVPADSVLSPSALPDEKLLSTVTSQRDRETYELEQVFNHLMLRLRDSMTNELALREGALHAQLSALQTQINPHFIYNTLNIISAKSMESGNYEVIEICDQFAQMLRYSTDTRSRIATMAEEIENCLLYTSSQPPGAGLRMCRKIPLPSSSWKGIPAARCCIPVCPGWGCACISARTVCLTSWPTPASGGRCFAWRC